MQKAKNVAAQKPLVLKDWIYAADGKHIKELIKITFLEFYFMKRTIAENRKMLEDSRV
jgi:hypothetical protein